MGRVDYEIVLDGRGVNRLDFLRAMMTMGESRMS